MKRLFVVFVIVMMLFVVGCQSASVINVIEDEHSESIFFIDDENMITAGLIGGENSKYGGNGGDKAEITGINNAAIQDSYDLMTQLPYNSLINTDIGISEVSSIGTDSSDEANDIADKGNDNGIDDKHATLHADQDSESSQNNDNTILTIQHDTTHHDNDSYFGIQPASEEEPSLHDPSSDILSINERSNNENAVSSGALPISPETPSESPTNNQNTSNENDDPSGTQPASQEENSSIEPITDTSSTNGSSSDIPAFTIEIDSETGALIGYEGTASYVDLENECFTSIADNVFKDNEFIETVKLPNSVTDIGSGAFEGCYNLVTLQMPASIQSIGDCAFKDAAKLSGSIILSETDIIIGSRAFENTLIESIVLNNENGIKLTVESHAFANCSALTSIVISDRKSTLMLAENAFYQVEHITFYISKNSLRNAYSSTYTMEKLGTIQAPSFLAP